MDDSSSDRLTDDTANPRMTVVVGGDAGQWKVTSQTAVTGPPLPAVRRLHVSSAADPAPTGGAWTLRGVATNDRYTTRTEKQKLIATQAPIGRPSATRAAMILLRKNDHWWTLTQDERRAVLEEQSHHIAIGMRYLPAVARKLLHCRDLGSAAPFDFLGFLDFAPPDEPAFDEMLAQLRATPEWSFMDREIHIRLSRTGQ